MAYSWGDTSGLGSVAGTQTIPLAGGLMDQMKAIYGGMPAGLSNDERLFMGMAGMQNIFAQQNREQARETAREMFALQKEAYREADQMGKANVILGSFVKDVPAAFGAAARARNEYLPQQIQIAANSMQTGNAPYTPRNYYGFVG
jgi:hypothetical protein